MPEEHDGIYISGRSEEPSEKLSLLDQLRAEVSVAPKDKLGTYRVPERPNYRVVYDLRGKWDRSKQIRAVATSVDPNSGKETFNDIVNAALHLTEQCVRIENANGEAIIDDSGKPLTFKSPAFKEMTGCLDYTSAVRKFFVDDNDLIRHYLIVTTPNSSITEDDAPDPTVTSTT